MYMYVYISRDSWKFIIKELRLHDYCTEQNSFTLGSCWNRSVSGLLEPKYFFFSLPVF